MPSADGLRTQLFAPCQQVEGQNAYQFFIQPPDAPAFIGNTVG